MVKEILVLLISGNNVFMRYRERAKNGHINKFLGIVMIVHTNGWATLCGNRQSDYTITLHFKTKQQTEIVIVRFLPE